jgi:hypothetical protein
LAIAKPPYCIADAKPETTSSYVPGQKNAKKQKKFEPFSGPRALRHYVQRRNNLKSGVGSQEDLAIIWLEQGNGFLEA